MPQIPSRCLVGIAARVSLQQQVFLALALKLPRLDILNARLAHIATEEYPAIFLCDHMGVSLDRHLPGAVDGEFCGSMSVLEFFEGPGIGVDLDRIGVLVGN